jgi:hypothetical protein
MITWILITVIRVGGDPLPVILPGFISQAECVAAGKQTMQLSRGWDLPPFVCVQQTHYAPGLPAEKKP